MENTLLSKESQSFLENLRLYLFSSGKNEEEINDIVNELEDHLIEAEKSGTPIERIVGQSPKEYMESLSNEMNDDVRGWMKYGVLILIGAFSMSIIPDVLRGNLSYSLYYILSNITIMLLFLVGTALCFRYLATHTVSTIRSIVLLGILSAVPLSLFITVLLTDQMISSPTFTINPFGTALIGVLAALALILISIWAKSWVCLIIVAFLTLPEYLLRFTQLAYETQLIVSMIITYGGIAFYLLLFNRSEKKKEKDA
ncbi:HAAS domain-containing protein [Alkalihalobacillus sp. NPDC078783]